MATITYNDKVALYENSDIADINKVSANDMNEIKDVINENSINVGVEEPTEEKVWVEYSNNLFDKDSVLVGYALQRTSNTLIENSTYTTSDYCRVEPNTAYYVGISYSSTNFGVVYYDISKNYLSGAQLSNTFTTPDDAYFVRFTWITANYDIDTIMLNPGSTALDYEPYTQSTININNNGVYEKFTDTLNVGTEENGKCRVNVLKSRNLFDKDDVNWYRNNASAWNDTTNTSTTRIRTTPISVKPNTTYTLSGTPSEISLLVVNEYTTYGTERTSYISSSGTFTTSDNIKYIAFIFGGTNFTDATNTLMKNANIMLNEGSTALDYEPYIASPSISVDGEEIYNQNIMIYDDTERVIGTWFGKPIYKKCFTGTTDTSATTTPINLSIDKLIDSGGYVVYDTNTQFQLNSVYGSFDNAIRLIKNSSTTIALQGGANTRNKYYEIWVMYTKTTD